MPRQLDSDGGPVFVRCEPRLGTRMAAACHADGTLSSYSTERQIQALLPGMTRRDLVAVYVANYSDLGYTEIQLLGQNVNSYRDPDGKRSFAELLTAVGEIHGIQRVRFTTSHPRDFGRDIVDAIESSPVLCDHVHLPIQSGSDRAFDFMGEVRHPRHDRGGSAEAAQSPQLAASTTRHCHNRSVISRASNAS